MNISVGTFIAIACQGEVDTAPTNSVAPSATPNPPVILTPMVYVAGTWSSGTPAFTRWEKSATGVGSWSTAAATMPNHNSAPTDAEFGLYLRPIETNDGVEAVGAAVGPVDYAYLFRDDFTTADAAPVASPRTAEPGPGTITFVQTDGELSIADGRLVFPTQTTAAWGDQGFYADSAITRGKGVALTMAFRLTDATGDAYLLSLLSAKNLNNLGGANVNAGILFNTGRYNPVSNASAADFTNGAAGAPLLNYHCQVAIVLRDTGAFLLFKGGTNPIWELLWVADTGNTASLYPGFSNQTIAGLIPHIRAADLVAHGYTDWNDNYALATHRTASPTTGVTATQEADAVIEFTWTPAAAETLTIEFRKTDASNLYKLVCDQAGGTIKLFRREAGVDTELDSGKTQTWTAGVARRITIRCYGTGIDTVVATTRKHATTGNTFNRTATGVAVSGFATGANLICWKRKLSGAFRTSLDNLGSDAVIPDNPNGFTATNAANALTIPTYDGSGEATHPSVWDFGDGETWNGYRYWMAMTPYPAGDDAKENPSILVSADGDTWEVPPGLTNPIVSLPGVGWFYSDPDLLYVDGTMYIYYRSSEGGVDNVYIRSSTDGVTWSAETLLFTATLTETLSPSVVYDGTQYVMYTINTNVGGGTPRKIQRRTCATPDGTWSAASDCTYYGLTSTPTTIWHLDVVKTANGYHAIVNTAPSTGAVMIFMTSADGLTWWQSTSNLLGLGAGAAWDSGMLYRASMVPTATGYDVWYSATNGDDSATWGIGKTAITRL